MRCMICLFFFLFVFCFFFQAEDGIRDRLVTGVQTCALPILLPESRRSVANFSTGGGALVYVAPVPRTSNGVQPSRPSDGPPESSIP